jgi:DNA-binding transcriptional MerR regulator
VISDDDARDGGERDGDDVRADGGAGSASAIHPRSDSNVTFGITAAAERSGVGEQTLRLYESKGLFQPTRTSGGTRRYSESDLEVVRRAVALLAAGLNLAGVAAVIRLEDDNARLYARATAAERRLRRRAEGQIEPRRGHRGDAN